MKRLPRAWLHVCAIGGLLTIAAVLAPQPWYDTDREQYQALGRAGVLRDCSALHCFRILVPSVLEQLPGPSIPKWKAFAVILNTAAAAAVASFALALGLSSRASLIAMWLSGLGFGALFTVFDPYSADPLMFLLGPLTTRWLLVGRWRIAGWTSAVFVLAKEFAAAPLWIWSGASLLARRWSEAARAATLAFAATAVWLVLQAVLMVAFNNTYGGNPSADIFGGGYITVWWLKLGPEVALTALLTEYGALYLLAPVGFLVAMPELRRIAVASIPAVLALVYVQQPDRALWNFHFLVTPLAAIVLARAPLALVVAFLGLFAVANLRSGAQLLFLPAARYALLLSVLLAAAAIACAWVRRPQLRPVATAVARPPLHGFPLSHRALLAASAIVVVMAGLLLADMEIHRAVELADGLNREGHRGEVLPAKRAGEYRIALVGGDAVFSANVQHPQSAGQVLENYLHQRWRWTAQQRAFVYSRVANLSQPNDTAARAAEALRDYRGLDADVAVIVTGYNDLPDATLPPGGRRDSLLFRTAGYLPVLPALLARVPVAPAAPQLHADSEWIRAHLGKTGGDVPARPCEPRWLNYCDDVARAVDYSLGQGQHVLVVTEPYISREHFGQQRALAGMLAFRYRGNSRVRYRDLGWLLDPLDQSLATGASKLKPRGIEAFADGVVTTLIAMAGRS